MKFKKLIFLLAVLVVPLVAFVASSTNTAALSGSQFKAGNIIADSLFYRGNAMTSSQIQAFLNSKVPNCDTAGTKPYKGTTRAKYGTSKGYPPPYTCLKNYQQSTPSKAANEQCSAYTGGTKSAANIINEVAKACKISQKAIIVLLEKEQSLITDDWPWSVQYRSATGYGCPDTAVCDSQYYGFFNQIYNAAKQFNRYKQNPDNYNHIPNRTNPVRYHPNASCGSKSVAIINYSSAGLYNYTPYTPNPPALSNLYGSGDGCSAYGNRNFWRLYSDWFGSTNPKCTSSDRVGNEVYRLFSTKTGKHFYTGMACEADTLEAYSSYRLEGVAFTLPPIDANERTGVYRMQNKTTGSRFWTATVAERDNLVKHGYRLEGTAFIGLKASSTTKKVAVYRLYNKKTGSHLWSSSVNEVSKVDAKPYWKLEGIAYYVFDNN